MESSKKLIFLKKNIFDLNLLLNVYDIITIYE